MGIASLILGIISIILGLLPYIWGISIFFAIIGLVLGIISLAKKQQKIQSIIGIVTAVIAMIILLIMIFRGITYLGKTISNMITNIEENKSSDEVFEIEKEDEEKLKENIKAENLGLTENGNLALKIINNNEKPVYIDKVNAIFRDINGKFVFKDSSESSYFVIPANSEVITYLMDYDEDFSQYPTCEFEFELSNSWTKEYKVYENFEVESNDTGKQIAIEIENNNNIAIDNIKIVVVYYQGNKVVGCEQEIAYEKVEAYGSAYVNMTYPEDSNDENVSFDRYEVYILGADKAT